MTPSVSLFPHSGKSKSSRERLRHSLLSQDIPKAQMHVWNNGNDLVSKNNCHREKRQPENKIRHTTVDQVERWAKVGVFHMGKQK